MTQQFNTIKDALKWCIDHPNQRLVDKDGRKVWFNMNENRLEKLGFRCNLMCGETRGEDNLPALHKDLQFFHLPTLRPIKTEPEKPTLNNLAALENWDWFTVTLPTHSHTLYRMDSTDNTWHVTDYTVLIGVLLGKLPVEFGRDEA